MKFMIAPAVLLLSSFSIAQTPSPVTVKSSPNSDALVKTAQDLQTAQKSLDTLLQQARTTLDASQKSLQSSLQKASEDLRAKLKSDKKYKNDLDKIDELQKQIQTSQQQAQTNLQQESAPIQNEVAKDKILIDYLTPVVRKENDLSPAANFDPVGQKWTEPKAADKPAEVKK